MITSPIVERPNMESPTQIFSYDSLAEAYMDLRNQRDQIRKQADEQLAQIENDLGVISAELNRMFNEAGLSSAKTKHGTIIRSLKTSYQVRDGDALRSFVKMSGEISLLQLRAAPRAIEEYAAANGGELPPGIHAEQKYDVTIRKS